MATLFFILLIVSALHLLLDGIIAPSTRLSLRYRLFEQRDRLRNCRARYNTDEFADELFDLLHDSINNAIRLLPFMTIHLFCFAHSAVENDAEIQRRIAHRERLLRECSIPEVLDIYRRTSATLRDALIANSSGWFIYLVPIALMVILIQKLSRFTQGLIAAPEGRLERISPGCCACPA